MKRPRNKTTILAAAIVACLVALLALSPIVAASPERSAARTGQSPPPHKKHKKKRPAKQRPSYWGAWIGTQLTGNQPPWDMSAVNQFEQLTGKPLSLIEFAAPFANCESSFCRPYKFPATEMNTIRSYGAIPFFSWGSQTTPVPDGLSEPDYSLAALASGAHDDYIREFAEAARNWGQPFFLRFDWEMNSNWFLWGEYANGNSPGQFVAAWQHVHDIFTSVGATNATWVWCPYAHGEPRFGPLARYYPGDEYVDWSCLDVFNWASNGVNSQPWRSFDEIIAPSYRQITTKIAKRKPMLLAEFASGGTGKRKAEWIKQMFKDLRTKYRRIRGLIWFEQLDRGVEWPIESAPQVTAAFSHGIRQQAFQPNLYPTLTGAPILPPR
jgi:mannan endo-1,4-beta-mannosidase